MSTIILRLTLSSRQPALIAAGRRARPARQRRLDAGPALLRDDPIAREPESQDASKAQPYEIESMYEMTHNLFVTPGYKPSGAAREEHQHDRRGAGLELVHEPDRREAGHGRRDRPRPQRRRAAGSVALGAHQREDRRRPSGLHGEGRARARPGSSSSIRPTSRRARPARSAIATKIFWALGYNQVESFLTTFDPKQRRDRSEGDDPPAVRRAGRRSRRTTSTRSSSASRATRTAPIASSPAG